MIFDRKSTILACTISGALLAIPVAALAQNSQMHGGGTGAGTGGSVSTSSTTSGAMVGGGTSGGMITSTGGTSTTSGFCIPGGLGCGPDSDLTPLGTDVPEPSSAALLLIGFGIIAAGSIRRRRKTA